MKQVKKLSSSGVTKRADAGYALRKPEKSFTRPGIVDRTRRDCPLPISAGLLRAPVEATRSPRNIKGLSKVVIIVHSTLEGPKTKNNTKTAARLSAERRRAHAGWTARRDPVRLPNQVAGFGYLKWTQIAG